MKKYLSFFRLRFSMGLQYRAAALAGIVTQFFWGFMEIMAFRAFYQTDPSAFPMTMAGLSSYVWLQQAFLALFAAWMMDNEIFDSIVNGDIAYELCRPVNLYGMWFSRNVANRMARAVLRCFPILAVALFLPSPYKITMPKSTVHFFLFLITLLLGLAMTVSFCMLVYMTAFFTISPQGLRILFTSAVEFFSGAIIPLPFLPDKLRQIMELLPFAAMQNVPLRIFCGAMSMEEMKKAIGLQVFWFVTITIAGNFLCRLAQRRVVVQGG